MQQRRSGSCCVKNQHVALTQTLRFEDIAACMSPFVPRALRTESGSPVSTRAGEPLGNFEAALKKQQKIPDANQGGVSNFKLLARLTENDAGQ